MEGCDRLLACDAVDSSHSARSWRWRCQRHESLNLEIETQAEYDPANGWEYDSASNRFVGCVHRRRRARKGGAIVGPHVLGLVQENATVHMLVEAGIAFFLFEVGLHLPLRRFVSGWRELFVLGPLQVVFCSAGLLLLARLLGLDWPKAALVAVVLSLSSTAVVLRLLQDHNELTTPVGQRIVSILEPAGLRAQCTPIVGGHDVRSYVYPVDRSRCVLRCSSRRFA